MGETDRLLLCVAEAPEPECILIGHAGYPEVERRLHLSGGGRVGCGRIKVKNPDNLTQATLFTGDICCATQNRQDAVRQLALECDLVLVVGSPNSSNSNCLL